MTTVWSYLAELRERERDKASSIVSTECSKLEQVGKMVRIGIAPAKMGSFSKVELVFPRSRST